MCDKNSSKSPTTTIIEQSIEDIIKGEGYITYNVNKKEIKRREESYLSEILEIDVTGKSADGDKETHLFVKSLIPGDQLDDFLYISDLFKIESFFYDDISKIYNDLQIQANVPLEERYRIMKSYPTLSSDVIILENVTRKGFKIPQRMEVISLKFAELSIQQLARFHGLSFVMEEKMPEYFNKKVATLRVPSKQNTAREKWLATIMKITLDNVDEDYKKIVEELIPIEVSKMWRHWSSSETLKCCLRYGDFRNSNIFIKEIDGEAAEVIPIDYQLIHYGTPVNDLIFLLFSSTDRQFRKDHTSYLKDLYHDSLGKFLKHFDINVDHVYPRNDFEKAFEENLDFGLSVALFIFPFIFVSDDMNFVKDDASTYSHAKLSTKFQKRFKEIIDEFQEWGYL